MKFFDNLFHLRNDNYFGVSGLNAELSCVYVYNAFFAVLFPERTADKRYARQKFRKHSRAHIFYQNTVRSYIQRYSRKRIFPELYGTGQQV